MEDEQIIRLYFDRSEQAIGETQRKYGSYCRMIARNILGSPEDSDECLDDALWKLWNLIPPNRPNCFRAFLGSVTRSCALTRYRALHAEKRGGGTVEVALSELEECLSVESVEHELEARRLTEALNSFLSGLPQETRIIFVKRYWYLASVKSIADDLGCTEGKVKMSLHRTRKQLKHFLEQEDIDL